MNAAFIRVGPDRAPNSHDRGAVFGRVFATFGTGNRKCFERGEAVPHESRGKEIMEKVELVGIGHSVLRKRVEPRDTSYGPRRMNHSTRCNRGTTMRPRRELTLEAAE